MKPSIGNSPPPQAGKCSVLRSRFPRRPRVPECQVSAPLFFSFFFGSCWFFFFPTFLIFHLFPFFFQTLSTPTSLDFSKSTHWEESENYGDQQEHFFLFGHQAGPKVFIIIFSFYFFPFFSLFLSF